MRGRHGRRGWDEPYRVAETAADRVHRQFQTVNKGLCTGPEMLCVLTAHAMEG